MGNKKVEDQWSRLSAESKNNQVIWFSLRTELLSTGVNTNQ